MAWRKSFGIKVLSKIYKLGISRFCRRLELELSYFTVKFMRWYLIGILCWLCIGFICLQKSAMMFAVCAISFLTPWVCMDVLFLEILSATFAICNYVFGSCSCKWSCHCNREETAVYFGWWSISTFLFLWIHFCILWMWPIFFLICPLQSCNQYICAIFCLMLFLHPNKSFEILF